MTGEIIAIGTELLLGQILNTNARFLSRQLARLGIDLYFQSVVGDNLPRVADSLRLALGRSDLVITCGGLGPTEDDLTREAVAAAAGGTLGEDASARAMVEDYFRRRQMDVPAADGRQWCLPVGARAIPNENGSAPGLLFPHDGKHVISLPGPPSELEPMFEKYVRPFLHQLPGRDQAVIHSRVLHLCGIGEAAAEERIRDILSSVNPSIASYARPGQVDLRITAKGAGRQVADNLIAPFEEAVRRRLGRHVFGADDDTLEAVVGEMLRRQGLTLALAESCTGGLIGQRITSVAGSSDYFLFNAVVYANKAKEKVLGVPAATLVKWGAVSRQTAVAMAQGARNVAGSDVAVSVTGIAGPGGGRPDKPVGTVYFGLAAPGGAWWRSALFPGERDKIRTWAAQEALAFLFSFLSGATESDPTEMVGERVER